MKELTTVLLVDDDLTTNFLNKFFVAQLDSNLKVETANNGKEAIDFIEANKDNKIFPMMVILDTNMPECNGWQFLEFFNKFDEVVKSQTKIIMITPYDSPESRGKALQDPNVKDTAQKPLSDIKFRALINKHFF